MGRNWRQLPEDFKSLYESYLEEVHENPVGATYFFKTFIYKDNFRKHSKVSLCPYCSGTKPNSRKGSGNICNIQLLNYIIIGATLPTHKDTAAKQRSQFCKLKQKLLDHPNILLLICDFTKHEVSSQDCQDLIITIYQNRNDTVSISIELY